MFRGAMLRGYKTRLPDGESTCLQQPPQWLPGRVSRLRLSLTVRRSPSTTAIKGAGMTAGLLGHDVLSRTYGSFAGCWRVNACQKGEEHECCWGQCLQALHIVQGSPWAFIGLMTTWRPKPTTVIYRDVQCTPQKEGGAILAKRHLATLHAASRPLMLAVGGTKSD